MYLQKVGDRMMEIRNEKKYSREYVQRRTGIPASTLQNYENGMIPGLGRLKKLADLYGCDVKDFLN